MNRKEIIDAIRNEAAVTLVSGVQKEREKSFNFKPTDVPSFKLTNVSCLVGKKLRITTILDSLEHIACRVVGYDKPIRISVPYTIGSNKKVKVSSEEFMIPIECVIPFK